MKKLLLCRRGVAPPDPPKGDIRWAGWIGVVWVDLCSSDTVPIALLGFASTAGDSVAQPRGASETGEGYHPFEPPLQTISGGQGGLGTMKKLPLC